jgi:hypothetical protein
VAKVLSTTTRAPQRANFRNGLDVDDRECRVGRRLDPDEASFVAPRGVDGTGVQVDRVHPDPVALMNTATRRNVPPYAPVGMIT